MTIPSGYPCKKCEGDGVSSSTAEPIESLPSFYPVALPCSDCSRRASSITPTTDNAENPYSIWYLKR